MRTDRANVSKPPLPALGPAGFKYRDAVFGTEILRATDERDCPAPGCGTYYSHWATFNCANTRLLVRCGVEGNVLVKAFDPAAFTVGAVVRDTPRLPGGVSLEWQGATWSRFDPDLIYLHVNSFDADYPATGMKLYAYKVSTNTFSLLKDFAPQLAPGKPDYLFEMHVDAKDDVFVFQHKSKAAAGETVAFIVWRKSDDKVLLHVPNDTPLPAIGGATLDANAGQPDKSGRWVFFPVNQMGPDREKIRLYDTHTSTWEILRQNPEDDPGGHGDLGTGFLTGRAPYAGTINARKLSAPHAPYPLLDMRAPKVVDGQTVLVTDWSEDAHMTLYADDESWVLLSGYDFSDVGEARLFEDEIYQVATDGSQRIRRLLHTRSKVLPGGSVGHNDATNGYWAIPKATISRDGRFIAYTSNWENSGRTDLFIARVGEGEAPPPPADPPPLPADPATPPVPPAPGPAAKVRIYNSANAEITSATLRKRGTLQLKAKFFDGAGREVAGTAAWTSSQPSVATVSQTGLVTAKSKPGQTRIYAVLSTNTALRSDSVLITVG